jgi:hypothetical protein
VTQQARNLLMCLDDRANRFASWERQGTAGNGSDIARTLTSISGAID